MIKRIFGAVVGIWLAMGLDPAFAGPTLPSLQPVIVQARADLTTGAPLIMPPAAGRAFKPTSFVNNSGVTYQRVYQLYVNASQVRFVFQNWAQTGSPEEQSPGAITIKASVIWNYTGGSTGVFVPITFSGAQLVTLNAYQTLISDPIDVGFATTIGQCFAVRTYVTTSGANLPVDVNDALPKGCGGYNEGYLSGDFTATVNSYGGATTTSGFGPIMVNGYDSFGDAAGAFLIGDSIPSGTGWTFGPANGYPPGYFNYFAATNNLGVYNGSRSGETLATQLVYSNAGAQYRLSAAHGFKYAVVESGTNDIAAGISQSTIEANLVVMWSFLQRRGMKVCQTTFLPRTNSTDGWTTITNQSPYGGAVQEATRQGLNQWLRAPSSAGAGNSATFDAAANGVTLNCVLDVDALLEANNNDTLISINPSTGGISNGAGGYWQVDTTTYDTGSVSTWYSNQKANDINKSWIVNQWWGYQLKITSDIGTPAAVGQIQSIATNTNNQLTTNVFATLPDSGAGYAIIRQPTADGIHPNTAGHIKAATALSKLLN